MQVTMAATVRQNRWPWLLLPARLMLFAFWQMTLALILFLLATPNAWQTAAAWWPPHHEQDRWSTNESNF